MHMTYNDGFELGYNFGRNEVDADEVKDLVFAGEFDYLKGFVDGYNTRKATDEAVMSLGMQEYKQR